MQFSCLSYPVTIVSITIQGQLFFTHQSGSTTGVPQLELNTALITALGIGLMIGIVRERNHRGDNNVAGLRTHALVAVTGFVAMQLGLGVYVAALFSLGLLSYGSYRITAADDPGLTGEVALLVNALLAGLAHTDAATAAGLGVVISVLLYAKPSLQHISRTWLAEGELNDALMVAAAALVILPLLPAQPLDPWGVVRLDVLWRVVVLIMAISVLGHWAQRLLGPRWGLPVAGFFSGWVSSTAAVATLGNQAREQPHSASVAAASALLANLASILLLLGILATAAPELFKAVLLPVAIGGIGLLVCVGALLWRQNQQSTLSAQNNGRAVSLKRASILAIIILSVSMASALLNEYLGQAAVLVGTVLVALAELHSAAIGLAQLTQSGQFEVAQAQWFILFILGASVAAKSVLAFTVGGTSYGARVLAGLATFLTIATATLMTIVK